MNYKATLTLVWLLLLSLTGANAFAEEHMVNAQVRVFVPDILYIQPGDTVHWMNMSSHDTVSQKGLVPEGYEGWRGDIGENLSVTLDKEGVYAYVCEPHIGFGMAGVVVVGKPVNIDAAMDYARANLQGPYRRLIGKLLKVQRAAKKH